jgi:hypothetical protein
VSNFKPYRLIEIHFEGEVKKVLVIGPLEKDSVSDLVIANSIFSRIYRAMVDTENMKLGLGNAPPDHRVNVTMTPVESWDDSVTGPISLRFAMVEQMIEFSRESLFLKPKPAKTKWTLGSIFGALWQNFMEFLDEFGENVKKSSLDPFGDAHKWV